MKLLIPALLLILGASPGSLLTITERTTGARVRAVSDEAGSIHVFVATAKRRSFAKPDLHHFVIQDDALTDEGSVIPLGFDNWQGFLDAGLDKEGRIHLFVQHKHLVLEDGAWRERPPPWSELRNQPWWAEGGSEFDAELFRAGESILGAFQARGKKLGTPKRIERFPWPDYPDKLILMRYESGTWSAKAVVDTDTKEEVRHFWVDGDDRGRVHVFYKRDRSGGHPFAYALMEMEGSEAAPEPARISGQSLDQPGLYVDSSGADFAVEPRSGDAMLAFVDRGSGWRLPGILRFRVIREGDIGPAARIGDRKALAVILEAVGGRFHLLTLERARRGPKIVTYRSWSNGSWSASVELGKGERLGALTAGDDGEAFAIWWQRKKLLGRRVGTD